jgi:hypothetical protein
MTEQQAIVGNIINSLNQTTITEKEDQDKQAVVEQQEAHKKAKERKASLSLFDYMLSKTQIL